MSARASTANADAAARPAKSVLRDYTETILVCVMFVVFSRAFVFQQSKIPSGSMRDTLLEGDYIMVNRFVYAQPSFAWEPQLLPEREPSRGDVVVFKMPKEPEIDYIKRLIAVPGDVVEIRDGTVHVNGARRDEPYVEPAYRAGNTEFGPITVPPGKYFFMGDHRNASYDSREWGFVDRELIKGRALMIWYSYPEIGDGRAVGAGDRLRLLAEKVIYFLPRSRWGRCFTLIR